MKKKYIVTGAAGFLGSHITAQLLDRGEEVRVLVLKNDPALKYVDKRCEIVEGDLTDVTSLEPLFKVENDVQTIVIHCASMVTIEPGYNQKLIDINVGGTKNMIQMCLSHPEVQKMVYVSSTGAIPELPKGQKIKEVYSFDEKDEHIVGWYSKSKAMATQAVLDAVKNDGLHACVVHPSGILGPKDYAVGQSTGVILQILDGEMPMGMGGSFNLCDVRDLAAGCVGAADHGKDGQCYILGNEEVTLKEICKMMKEYAPQSKPPKFFLPLKLSYFLARQMEKKAAKTGEKPLMTTFAVYNLDRNNSFDYAKAMNEIGYRTRPYSETIKDEIEWIQKERHLLTANH